MLESMEQSDLAFAAPFEVLRTETYEIQDSMSDPIKFLTACSASSADPDTMYLNQALKAPDRLQFIQAMKDEVQAHTDNDHWELVTRTSVPKGMKVLPSVWAMKRKRRILSREVYKWKARLNVHGGRQELGVNYWETYAPVVNWFTIRLFLILSILNKWHSRQIDFVLAYPQADIECEMYMEMPAGFKYDTNKGSHVLRLKKNIYGQKQAGRI
jgi:hypothetical protein